MIKQVLLMIVGMSLAGSGLIFYILKEEQLITRNVGIVNLVFGIIVLTCFIFGDKP
jgi:hypothetical protein